MAWVCRVVVLAGVLTPACRRASDRQAGPEVENGRNAAMPQSATEYPNYVKTADSPPQEGPGLAIRFAPPRKGDAYRVGEAIVLNGKYGADRAMNESADGNPLTHVVVRVGKAGEDKARGRPVQDGHNEPVSDAPPDEGGGYIVYGYFNLDLAKAYQTLSEAGKYWVQAELFELESERLEFEVK